jgi:hypothetical protein
LVVIVDWEKDSASIQRMTRQKVGIQIMKSRKGQTWIHVMVNLSNNNETLDDSYASPSKEQGIDGL